MQGGSPHRSVWFWGSSVFILFLSLSERYQLRACGEGVKHMQICTVWGAHAGRRFPSRLWAELWGAGGRNRGREGTSPEWFPVASTSLPFSLLISLWFLYPQKFQAVLMKEEIFFFFCKAVVGGWWKGMLGRKEVPWERARPQSEIFEVL